MKRICVYCGSSPGANPAHREAAEKLGALLAARGIGLVYGGGNIGLMGVVADAALRAGGEVIGVIPHALMEKELGHAGLTKLHVVGSMHERKQLMADLSDGFIALPAESERWRIFPRRSHGSSLRFTTSPSRCSMRAVSTITCSPFSGM